MHTYMPVRHRNQCSVTCANDHLCQISGHLSSMTATQGLKREPYKLYELPPVLSGHLHLMFNGQQAVSQQIDAIALETPPF